MSDILNNILGTLNDNLDASALSGSIKVAVADEGSLILDSDGARIADDDADCTLSMDAETFEGLLEGDVDPTAAFMTGKLKVDGDMSVAMSLSSALS